nr:tyrosine-type recombinase/integrase [Paracoccus alkanivorans]
MLQFVEERHSGGSQRLFPDQPWCPKNGYGRNAGRWFNERLLPALGMKSEQLVFHSLRHTMATLLSRNDVPDTQVKAILGHEQPGVTYSTYFHGFRPAQLQAAINRFGF